MTDTTAQFTSWPALIEALEEALNNSSSGISGGSPGQVLISNGSDPPGWSTLLTIPIPDNTATGGNSRGTASIDFQLSRNDPSQVTSGNYSVIIGGGANSNQDDFTSLVGGLQNTISGGSYNFLGGGNTNTITSCTYSFLGGGNTNYITTSSAYAALVGGSGNYIYDSNGGFIGAGEDNEVDYDFTIIVGGQYNYAENAGIVVGGVDNESTGQNSFIASGNNNQASDAYCFVGNGTANVASVQYSFIGSGGGNNASAEFSFIGNGSGNTSNGEFSYVGNGSGNDASNTFATVLNGSNNQVSGEFSTIINGQNSSDRGRYGWIGYSTGTFGNLGDQQAGITILSTSIDYTSGTNPKTLTSGNTQSNPADTPAPNATNVINLSQLSVLHVKGTVLGMDTVNFDTAAWSIEFVIKQSYGASSTAIVGSPTITSVAADTSLAAVVIAIGADTTNGGVAITVANPNSWNNVVYWQANLIVTEVAVPFT